MKDCSRLLLAAAVALAACSSPSDNSSLGDGGSSSGSSSGSGSSSSTSSGGISGSSSGSSTSGSSSSSSGAASGNGSSGSSSGGAVTDGGTHEGGARGDDAGAVAAEGGAADAGTDGGAGGFDPCPATGNCKVLPLGDSITFGTPTNSGGYRVELFARAIADSNHITFVGSQSNGPASVAGVPFPPNNEGHPGWVISQIDGIATTTQALKDSPQIILLHIGTNDMGASPAGAPNRLGQLIDKIVAALPGSLLAVSDIIPRPQFASNVTTYNAAVPGVVKQRSDQGKHVIYVEVFNGFPSNGLGTDGIHPNDNIGYPYMGDTWYTAIKPYLH